MVSTRRVRAAARIAGLTGEVRQGLEAVEAECTVRTAGGRGQASRVAGQSAVLEVEASGWGWTGVRATRW